MGFELPKEKYSGRIKEVAIGAMKEQGGTRRAQLIAGGSNGLPGRQRTGCGEGGGDGHAQTA